MLYELRLQADLTPGPSHAVKLIGGQFLLTHASGRNQTPLHRVCIVEKIDKEDAAAEAVAAPEQPQQKSSHKKLLPMIRRDTKKTAKQPAAEEAVTPGTVSFECRVVLDYGATPGSGDGQLSAPRGVALDTRRGGCVFVADRDNHRIVVVDHALDVGQTLKLVADAGLQEGIEMRNPRSIHLDQARTRLYVGEEVDGGRLLAIDNIDAAADALK